MASYIVRVLDRWPHVNHIARKKPKGGGQSPQFKMRIDPALKEQLDAVAAEEGVSLASWLKRTGEGGVAEERY